MKNKIMKNFALILLVFVTALLSACKLLTKPLSDADISQYIQTYNNIAAVSPTLEKQKSDSKSTTILTCTACHDTLRDAVTKAGYADIKSFLIADARMHLTLNLYYHLKLTELVGEAANGVPAEDFCKVADLINGTPDPKQATEYCRKIKTTTGYLKKLGDVVVNLAKKLLSDGDIETVGKQVDSINAALTNENLIADFKHVAGGGFDD
jgi:hypothetical protein